MKTRSVLRSLTLLSWCLMLAPVQAARRVNLEGHVSLASITLGIYRVGQDSTSDPASFPKVQANQASSEQLRFTDPAELLTSKLGGTMTFQPGRYTLILEVAESGTNDVIECVLLSATSLDSISSPGSWTSRPDLFAGAENSLYPSLDAPVFRELEFELNDLDSDGDGVSNLKDAFPNDPAETKDTDGDGIGNNADPDDDNDLMTDVYEIANGLIPTSNDADGDLDHDGHRNFAEYVTGTSANDGSSFFRARMEPSLINPPQWRISFPVIAGRTYQVKIGPSLNSPLVPLGPPIVVNTNGNHELFRPGTDSNEFFKIEINLTNP